MNTWVTLAYILFSFSMGALFTAGLFYEKMDRHRREEKKARDYILRLEVSLNENKEKYIALEGAIDREVEERLQKQIREWIPEPTAVIGDFEAAASLADKMALKRRTIDAGRRHPERADTDGPPARVTHINISSKNAPPQSP